MIDMNEWLTLKQVAAQFNPPITVEALRLRLFKPGAPEHRFWRNRWLVKAESLAKSDWLDR